MATNKYISEEVGDLEQHKKSIHDKQRKHDYTNDKKSLGVLHEFLTQRFDQDFSLVDLGCGDARGLLDALKNTKLRSYQGLDVSPKAIEAAKGYAQGLSFEVQLSVGDLFPWLQETQPCVEVFYIGYVLHHFVSEKKEEVLRQCFKHLKPGGCVLMLDPTLQENDSFEDYLKRWDHALETKWTALTQTEKGLLRKHVATEEYPETFAAFEKMAKNCGFEKTESLYKEPGGIFELICLERKS